MPAIFKTKASYTGENKIKKGRITPKLGELKRANRVTKDIRGNSMS